jgi:uncharacterized protein (DUF488 family)
MEKKPIYSIGHGNRKLDDFIVMLKKFNILYLIDVRSVPYSKFNDHYNRNQLESALKGQGIKYVYMGDSLGGRPKDPECYRATDSKKGDIDEKRVDYTVVMTKEFYKRGIERLKTAYEKDLPVALMCSEANPSECHRSKLIGSSLHELHIPLQHIDESGELKDQQTVMLEVNKGRADIDLFGNKETVLSQKTH